MKHHVPTLHRECYRTLWLLWINRKKLRFFICARNCLWLWIKGQKSDGRLQIWCSIQVSLHTEPPEVWLVEILTRSLYWWVEQCVPTRNEVSGGRQKLTSAMKLRPESDVRLQIWCSIQVNLHRKPPEVGLVIKLEKWFTLQGEQAHCLKLFCMYDKTFEISKTK